MPAKGYYKFTLADCQGYARKRGGRCLSEEYHGGRLLWECAQGHRWYQKFKNYSSTGGWCRRCVIKKHTLEDVQAYARRHGGRCLSKTYPPTRVKWECRDRHRWASNFLVVRQRGSWCPLCSKRKAGLLKRFSIHDARLFAQKKGGKFLSKTYTLSRRRYLWECANGHRWKTTLDKIKNSRGWCPYCSDGSGEECVRACFQGVFRRRFPRGYPAWLVDNSGRSLELDGFNARLGVAFEHQGRMHYINVRHFFRGRRSFQRRLALDRLKHRLCRQHGIRLVKIPEVGWKFPLERLLPEVIRRCRQRGIRVPAGAERRRINYAPAMNMNPDKSKKYLKILASHARKKGGKLLEKSWLGHHSKHRFRCRQGHVFRIKIGNLVSNGGWCMRCELVARRHRKKLWWNGRGGMLLRAKMKKLGDRWMKQIHAHAKKKGGDCLTKEWPGWKGLCRLRCGKCGRVWTTGPQKLINGQWCRSCASRECHARNRAKRRSVAF